MGDTDVIYEVHVPTLTPELAGRVMRFSGTQGALKTRIYAIEDGRRRPLRQKEYAAVVLGATEPELVRQTEPSRLEQSEILEAIRFNLEFVKRALLGRITP